MQNNGYELDWDSTIDQDEQQYVTIPEGDYDYIVDHIDRTNVSGADSKYSGAKMATVFFNVQVPGQESVQIRENFILHSNFAWKIGALLVSAGLKKHGEPISGNYWGQLPGCRGRCKVIQTTSNKNPDRKYNNISNFYAPGDKKDGGTNQWAI